MQEEFDRQQLQSERQELEEQRQQFQSERQELEEQRQQFQSEKQNFAQNVEEFEENQRQLAQNVEEFEEEVEKFKPQVQQEFEKNFLEEYHIYRDHIKHEDTLANQRLSFFIGSQSFLFFPYFNVLKDYRNNGYSNYDTVLLLGICSLGFFTCSIITPSIQGFVDASSAISRLWKKNSLINYMNFRSIRPLKYKEETKLSETEETKLSEIEGITKDNLLEPIELPNLRTFFKKEYLSGEKGSVAFLEIDRILGVKKIIPNIRYENSDRRLNRSIILFSNNISKCFRWIWLIAFFGPVIFFRCSMPSNRSNSEKLMIQYSQELIQDIQDKRQNDINQELKKIDGKIDRINAQDDTIRDLRNQIQQKDE